MNLTVQSEQLGQLGAVVGSHVAIRVTRQADFLGSAYGPIVMNGSAPEVPRSPRRRRIDVDPAPCCAAVAGDRPGFAAAPLESGSDTFDCFVSVHCFLLFFWGEAPRLAANPAD